MIPVNKFKLLTSDRNILIKALKKNWISSAGPEVKVFEKKLQGLVSKKAAAGKIQQKKNKLSYVG